MEKIFDITIIVLQLDPDFSSTVLWSSGKANSKKKKMYLNKHEDHFSLIKRIDIYAHTYDCLDCGTSFARHSNLKRHKQSGNCDSATTIKYPGGNFTAPPTIFDELKRVLDIDLEEGLRHYPYRITYDIECYMEKTDLPSSTEHTLLSISVCSNVHVTNYKQPRCLIADGG